MAGKPRLEMNVFYHPNDDKFKEEILPILNQVSAAGIAKIRTILPHDDCCVIYAYYPVKFAPGSESRAYYGPTAIKYFLNKLSRR